MTFREGHGVALTKIDYNTTLTSSFDTRMFPTPKPLFTSFLILSSSLAAHQGPTIKAVPLKSLQFIQLCCLSVMEVLSSIMLATSGVNRPPGSQSRSFQIPPRTPNIRLVWQKPAILDYMTVGPPGSTIPDHLRVTSSVRGMRCNKTAALLLQVEPSTGLLQMSRQTSIMHIGAEAATLGFSAVTMLL
jgi:hypothetical protein